MPGSNYHELTTKYTIGGSGKLSQGTQTYTVVIESYQDTNQADKIYLAYTGASGSVSKTYDLTAMGFGTNDIFSSAGFWAYDNEGGTISVSMAQGYGYARSVKETPPPVEPDVPDIIDPSVPEPSAFGLLAGLGALALVASRRRR